MYMSVGQLVCRAFGHAFEFWLIYIYAVYMATFLLNVDIMVKETYFLKIYAKFPFLHASSHLYMRVCPSTRPSIRDGKIDDFDRKMMMSHVGLNRTHF